MANTSWIARCKAYMKQHGCQLGEAMKALSNKNKGKGKSFRGGNTGGVADHAEAFSAGAPPPPTTPHLDNLNKEPNTSMFEVGAQPAKLVMDGGRRKRTNRRRGCKSKSKSKSRSRSRSRSRSGRNRHRSRRGGGHGLSFSEYN